MIIVIDDYGVAIAMRNRCFLIRKGETKRQISPFRVTAIHVRKGCDISSPALLLAAEHSIPVLLFDNKGKVKARLWEAHFGSLAEIRRQQLYWSDKAEGMAWAAECLIRKANRQRKVLKWLSNRVPSQAEALSEARQEMKAWLEKLRKESIGFAKVGEDSAAVADQESLSAAIKTTRGAEAQIARHYWEAYFDALEKYEQADKRTRQPAQDPLNALINYGYGMLYGEVEAAVLTAGLDPHLGVFHRETYNKPAFVFDAIEPFRPWVDRLVAELAIGGKLQGNWFKINKKKVWLRKEGKAEFIPAWYEMLYASNELNGRRIKRKDQIQLMLRDLAQSFLSDELLPNDMES